MANWDLLETVTNFDTYSVASDGTDLYFVQLGGGVNYHVFKYTVATDTVSQLSNDASWGVTGVVTAGQAGGLTIGCLQWFKNNLYVSVYAALEANPHRVYRYSGAGTAWTNVYAGTSIYHAKWGLISTADHILHIPSSRIDEVFKQAEYSSDGASWSAASIGNSPASYGGNFQLWSTVMLQGTNKIVLADRSDDTADFNYRWFEWDGAGGFNITNYTENIGGGGWSPSDAWLRTPAPYFGDLLHWYVDGTTYKYAENLGDAWLTPGNNNPGGAGQITPIVSIGYTQQLGTGGGSAYILDGGSWVLDGTVDLGNDFTHAAKMTSRYGYAMNAASRIFGRDTQYPVPAANGTLYIYKSTDLGNNWTTKKVET